MNKNTNFEIDIEIYKLELEGIDKVLDITKLIVSIGTPACALLLSQGLRDWWQLAAFGVLAGVVAGAFVELFIWTGDRNRVISKMKRKYLKVKSRPRGFLHIIAGRKDSA